MRLRYGPTIPLYDFAKLPLRLVSCYQEKGESAEPARPRPSSCPLLISPLQARSESRERIGHRTLGESPGATQRINACLTLR
jgi:hypothetical protein